MPLAGHHVHQVQEPLIVLPSRYNVHLVVAGGFLNRAIHSLPDFTERIQFHDGSSSFDQLFALCIRQIAQVARRASDAPEFSRSELPAPHSLLRPRGSRTFSRRSNQMHPALRSPLSINF